MASLEQGDEVRLTNRKTGKRYRFTVVELTSDGFIGRHDNDRTYRVLYADLASLEVKRGDWHVFALPITGDIKFAGADWRLLAGLGLVALLRRRARGHARG